MLWSLIACATATVLWLVHWVRSGQGWYDRLELDAMHMFARLWHRCAPRPPCTLPATGPALLIANHPSHADPAFLLASVQRPLHFLQARECYQVPWLRRLFARSGCIPVSRTGQEVSGIRQALRHLAREAVIAVFPEGDVAPSGRQCPRRGKPGAALLALRSGAPVFPAWIAGGPESHHMIRAWLCPSHGVRVVFGPAIDLSSYRNHPITPLLLREVTDLLMRHLEALSPDQARLLSVGIHQRRSPAVRPRSA